MSRTLYLSRALALVLVFTLILPLLAACGESRAARDPLAYLKTDMAISVRGELWGIAFAGVLRRKTDGEAALTFTAPAALAGMTVSRCGESRTLTLGQNSYTPANPSDHALFRLLLPLTKGNIISQSEGEDGGLCAAVETPEGTYTVYTDAAGIPLAWECDGMRMTRAEDTGNAGT